MTHVWQVGEAEPTWPGTPSYTYIKANICDTNWLHVRGLHLCRARFLSLVLSAALPLLRVFCLDLPVGPAGHLWGMAALVISSEHPRAGLCEGWCGAHSSKDKRTAFLLTDVCSLTFCYVRTGQSLIGFDIPVITLIWHSARNVRMHTHVCHMHVYAFSCRHVEINQYQVSPSIILSFMLEVRHLTEPGIHQFG